MTTRKWVKDHLSFALKTEDLEKMMHRIRAVVTRLNLSPLEKSSNEDVFTNIEDYQKRYFTKSVGKRMFLLWN